MKVIINGRQVEVTARRTVLEVARENGIFIPSLCDHQQLAPFGGCRLCLVEIKGRNGFPPACSTLAEDGLEITTETPRLQAIRRQILELILSEHPNACLICTEKQNCDEYKSTIRKVGEVTGCVLCPNNGRCQLQEVVEALKIKEISFPSVYRNLDVHREDPFFDRNYNLCILCGRCVRICRELRGASVLSFVFRGSEAVIGTAFDRSLLESGCQFCGACVDVCPTGALVDRAAKPEGAADQTTETICPLCSLGCTLELGLRGGRIISSSPKAGEAVNKGQACVKGRFILRDAVYTPSRLLKPMIRRDGGLREVGWDEALEFVAQKLKTFQGRDLELVASAQLPLEDSYVIWKFADKVLKTDVVNSPFPGFGNLSLGEALREKDEEVELNFELSSISGFKVIGLVGLDVAATHPILWLEILRAVGQGAKLVAINSGGAALRRYASVSLQTKPGLEYILLADLCRRVNETLPDDLLASLADRDAFGSSLDLPDNSGALASMGISSDELEATVRLFAEGGPSVFLFCPSLANRPAAGVNWRLLRSLALLSGGRMIPLAGLNNERGNIELQRQFSRKESLSRPHRIGGDREIRALYLNGPLPPLAEKSMEFLVVQDCYQNENTELADAVLPASTFAETEGSFVNAEGRIQKFKKVIEPLGESKPDWWIVGQIAQRMGSRDFSFKGPSDIAEELGQAVPALEALSHRHQRKGKPHFVVEERKMGKRLVPVEIPSTDQNALSEHPSSVPMDCWFDHYRSLNLRAESKGLRRLRERQTDERKG
jgi:formate dehydrogenase alpha subunit